MCVIPTLLLLLLLRRARAEEVVGYGVVGDEATATASRPLLPSPVPRSFRRIVGGPSIFRVKDYAAHAIGPRPRLPPCRIHSATSHRSRLHPMRNRDIHPPRWPVRPAPCASLPPPPPNHDTPSVKLQLSRPLRPSPPHPTTSVRRSFIPLVPTIPSYRTSVLRQSPIHPTRNTTTP